MGVFVGLDRSHYVDGLYPTVAWLRGESSGWLVLFRSGSELGVLCRKSPHPCEDVVPFLWDGVVVWGILPYGSPGLCGRARVVHGRRIR